MYSKAPLPPMTQPWVQEELARYNTKWQTSALHTYTYACTHTCCNSGFDHGSPCIEPLSVSLIYESSPSHHQTASLQGSPTSSRDELTTRVQYCASHFHHCLGSSHKLPPQSYHFPLHCQTANAQARHFFIHTQHWLECIRKKGVILELSISQRKYCWCSSHISYKH